MKIRSFLLLTLIALTAIGLTNIVSSNSAANSTRLSVEPSVKFHFDGLMAICFGNPERTSVGFLNVPHHTPLITVEKLQNGRRTKLGEFRGDQLHGNVTVSVEGGSSGTRGGKVARFYAASREASEQDFRWTVDMESDLFQKQLYVREDRLAGKIHFKAGVFYAENLTEQPVRFYSADGKQANFERRIAVPAAQLDLKTGESLVIKGNGFEQHLTAAPGVQFEVSITNLPPADMASMDHWLYYYDAISEKVTPYTPVMVKKAAYFPKPLLCQSGVFGRSELN